MKRTILALSILAIIFTGCAQNKTTDKKTEVKKEAPAKPEHVKISDENLQGNIAKSMQDDFAVKETQNVKEAIQIIGETNNVLKFIAEDKPKKPKTNWLNLSVNWKS